MLDRVKKRQDLSEIPRRQRRKKPKPLKSYEKASTTRNEAISQAYASGGLTLAEIGAYFGLHYSTVSGILKNHKSRSEPILAKNHKSKI